MGKRIWKPLDHEGLRLYKVTQRFYFKLSMIGSREDEYDDEVHFVMAQSPSEGAKLVERCYQNVTWDDDIDHVDYFGKAVNVLIPEEWWG